MDEIIEIRLAEFENRLRTLESGKADQQGQNAQLPGFVPIPQIVDKSVANGPFEPSFKESNGSLVLDSVGEGYWPYGRKFYSAVTVDSSAKVSSGLVAIRITHGVGTSPASAKIIGGSDVNLQNPSNLYTDIPLYRIENGRIAADFRHCLSLAIRE